jgi:hypothetical protein
MGSIVLRFIINPCDDRLLVAGGYIVGKSPQLA